MDIDQLTYINLDQSLDRFIFINDQLKSIPNNIFIFKTSGIVIDTEQIKYYNTNNKKLKTKESFRGTVGCYMSHKIAMLNLMKNIETQRQTKNYSMIIEDDIIINHNFWNVLQDINDVPSSVDIIFFDNTDLLLPTGYFHETPKYNGRYNGAFCYAIKNSSIHKVFNLLNSKKLINHVDHVMYNDNNIITYSYISNLIKINKSFISDRLSIN